MLFLNCSQLSISYGCIEDEEGDCEESQSKTKPLSKKSMDILIVLDNSPLGQKLNPQITTNLKQFLQCIKPLDWQVGIVSGVKNKQMGMLLPLEGAVEDTLNLENQEIDSGHNSDPHFAKEETETDSLLTESSKIISVDMANHKQIFSKTVSLSSGCEYPPFCHKGKRRPLSAVKAFMQNTEEKSQLLRESTFLSVVVVSSSDEQGGVFSAPDVTAQKALSMLSAEYDTEQFATFSVTDAGHTDDCIKTAGDIVRKGTSFLATTGQIAGMIFMEPLMIVGSALLSYKSDQGSKPKELAQFAEEGGGEIFDICKPFFGRALAYSMLKSVDRESQFPEKCQQFSQKKSDKKSDKKKQSKK